MGIVLNRPLARPSFEDLVVQLDVEPRLRRVASGYAQAVPWTTSVGSCCTPPIGRAMAACG